MKWSYAKNIVLIMLIILNVLLFGLRSRDKTNEYTLSDEAEINIKNVLENYNVFLYATLPTEYYPMKNIEITRRQIDNDSIIKHFFKKTEDVKKTNDGNKEIYYLEDNEYVEIYRNGVVKYISILEANTDSELPREDAYKMLTDFIPRVYKGNRIYKPTVYNKENNEYIYTYYNTYNGITVLNDYMKATISNEKLEVEVWGTDILNYVGNKTKIISVDEALFNFTKNVFLDNEESVYISDIELGYYAINDNLIINNNVISEPYYKVSVRYYGDYYINAYTNKIYDKNLLEINY